MIKDFKIGAFSRPVSDLSDNPEISAGELKAHFDSNSYELLASLNGLIDYLSGEDALGELKISGKSLYELLEQKVSKEAGKGLSSNDYTTEEKQKLASLAGFDEAAINEKISGKVDKEAGKGLSSNDYTTEEKQKLASLSNYNDSSIKQSLLNKVDKQAGKGLSSNDYTTEEKQKLASLSNYDDSQLRGLIERVSGTFRELDYADIDKMDTPRGIYKLINIPINETNIEKDENNKDELYPTEELLFISDCYEHYINSLGKDDWEDGILQVRYRGDGTILRRWTYWQETTHTGKWRKVSAQTNTNTIPEIDYADIDDVSLAEGVYKLVNIPEDEPGTRTNCSELIMDQGLISAYPVEELLFISKYTWEYTRDSEITEDGILQVRYRGDGTVLRRIHGSGIYGGTDWSAWTPYSTHPELDYKDIDDKTLPKGIYTLINIPRPDDREIDHDYYHSETELLFISYKGSYDANHDTFEDYAVQLRYQGDGTILRREGYAYGTFWSEWKSVSTEVIDNLTSTSSTACLSANMGRELNEKIDGVECTIPELDYVDIDNALSTGLYKLINMPEREINHIDMGSNVKSVSVYSSSDLLVISKCTAVNALDDCPEDCTLQVRYCADGTILQRYKNEYDIYWTDWKLITASKTEIDNIKTQMGDIESALDEIIALQNSYTGGDSE